MVFWGGLPPPEGVGRTLRLCIFGGFGRLKGLVCLFFSFLGGVVFFFWGGGGVFFWERLLVDNSLALDDCLTVFDALEWFGGRRQCLQSLDGGCFVVLILACSAKGCSTT